MIKRILRVAFKMKRVIGSILMIGLSIFFFMTMSKRMFINANIDINISKSEVIFEAKSYAKELGFEDYEDICTVENDYWYIEYLRFKSEGVKSLKDNMQKYKIYPTKIVVSFIKSYSLDNLKLYFSHNGDKLGYNIFLSEDVNLNSLNYDKAKNLAEKELLSWSKKILFEFNNYEEVGHSITHKPGYSEHEFVYEDKNVESEIKKRYIIKVSGDRVTSFYSNIYVPEIFLKEYNDIRSLNNISSVVSISFLLFLFVIMFILFLLYIKNRRLSIDFSIKIVSVFFLLLLLSSFTHLKMLRVSSNVMVPYLVTLANYFILTIRGSGIFLVILFVLVSVALTLDEEAFPNHPNFRSLGNSKFLASDIFIVSVMKGYLFFGLKLLSVISFYYIANKIGWSSGIDIVDASSFNSYMHYIKGFVDSLRAGFWEELFFRVLPISFAVILTKRYNLNKKVSVIFSILLSSFVFGLAHTNYPAVPFYFRIVELFPISIVYSLAYLRCGIITAVVAHWIYDYFLMTYTLLVTPNYFGYTTLLITIVLGLIPILVHIYFRYVNKIKGVNILNRDMGNEKYEKLKFELPKVSNSTLAILLFVLILVFKKVSFNKIDKDISSVDMQNLRSVAVKCLKDVDAPFNLEDVYVGREHNNLIKIYSSKSKEDIINKLTKPNYTFKFENRERLVNGSVNVNIDGELLGYCIFWDDSIDLVNIDKDRALDLAKKTVLDRYGIKDVKVKDVISVPKKSRVDWNVVLDLGDNFRVEIDVIGDRVMSFKPLFHFNEETTNRVSLVQSYENIFTNLSNLILGILSVIFIFISIYYLDFSLSNIKIYPSIIFFLFSLLKILDENYDIKSRIPIYSNIPSYIFSNLSFSIFWAILLSFMIMVFFFILSSFNLNIKRKASNRLLFSFIGGIVIHYVVDLSERFLVNVMDRNVLWFNLNSLTLDSYKIIRTTDKIYSIFTTTSPKFKLFTYLFSNYALISFSLISMTLLAIYFNNRLISFLIFLAYSLSFTNCGALVLSSISALILGLVLYILHQIYFKSDPLSIFYMVMFFLVYNNLDLIFSKFVLSFIFWIVISQIFILPLLQQNIEN